MVQCGLCLLHRQRKQVDHALELDGLTVALRRHHGRFCRRSSPGRSPPYGRCTDGRPTGYGRSFAARTGDGRHTVIRRIGQQMPVRIQRSTGCAAALMNVAHTQPGGFPVPGRQLQQRRKRLQCLYIPALAVILLGFGVQPCQRGGRQVPQLKRRLRLPQGGRHRTPGNPARGRYASRHGTSRQGTAGRQQQHGPGHGRPQVHGARPSCMQPHSPCVKPRHPKYVHACRDTFIHPFFHTRSHALVCRHRRSDRMTLLLTHHHFSLVHRHSAGLAASGIPQKMSATSSSCSCIPGRMPRRAISPHRISSTPCARQQLRTPSTGRRQQRSTCICASRKTRSRAWAIPMPCTDQVCGKYMPAPARGCGRAISPRARCHQRRATRVWIRTEVFMMIQEKTSGLHRPIV